jgi:hypothetical protein
MKNAATVVLRDDRERRIVSQLVRLLLRDVLTFDAH